MATVNDTYIVEHEECQDGLCTCLARSKLSGNYHVFVILHERVIARIVRATKHSAMPVYRTFADAASKGTIEFRMPDHTGSIH